MVQDSDDKPIAGATVVVGLIETGRPNHHVLKTDNEGRFSWQPPAGMFLVHVYAYKEGWAVSATMHSTSDERSFRETTLHLGKPGPHKAILVDESAKPVAGAAVKLEMCAHAYENKTAGGRITGAGYTYYRREVLEGSPLEQMLVTRTDDHGEFAFGCLSPDAWLRLAVTTADGRHMRVRLGPGGAEQNDTMMEAMGFVPTPAGSTARLIAFPAARVQGRVTTKLAGVSVSGLKVSYQGSRLREDGPIYESNFGSTVVTDAEGRFVLDDLNEGTINIMIDEPGENVPWTYRAAENVELKSGWSKAVLIELIKGVEVEGTVVAKGTGQPVQGAQLGVYGPYRPKSGAGTRSATTDARGHYHYRLPSGETYFYVMGPPTGYTSLPQEGSSRTVTIPERAIRYEVPPIEIASAVTVRGQVVDSAGQPVVKARVVGVCQGGMCRAFAGAEVVTDPRGEFQLAPGPNNTVPIGTAARLQIRLADGSEHEAAVVPGPGGTVTVKLPVLGARTPRVSGPTNVQPNELAGVVVDPDGKPIEGVEVDAWTWYRGNETRTDAQGFFRLKKLDKDRKVEVQFRKSGYTPRLFLTEPTGIAGWIVVMGNKTYFEGKVIDPHGKPVKGALIRANNGPKQADGVMITEIWTEATTDAEGRYRMYAQEDVYDIQVRIPGVGAARLASTPLTADEAKHLDIPLQPGVVFHARAVDAGTGRPVDGVRLWHWQHPGIEGRSGEDGIVTVADMLPGPFNFEVEAPGYTRWWSDQAVSQGNRRSTIERLGGWQRNFDHLDFNLSPGMEPVTITMERGVTIKGRVLDPDGHPVPGATVAPALTGTGNSLTGDTRFSVATDGEGRFTVLLPASGSRDYNLVAHDGNYGEWRTWANGVLPPIRTKPGEERHDVEIKLTRPATVKGRVTDTAGHPVAGREVRASAADRLENRYYDPTTTTTADGSFTLKYVRPGDQWVQVAPFWLDARSAPRGTSKTVALAPDQVQTGVEFQVPRGDQN